MDYNLTREQASDILGISTRTLDRWIRKGLLSHEKRANKVYLSEEEVRNYNQHKEVENVVIDTNSSTKKTTKIMKPEIDTKDLVSKIGEHMDESLGKFIDVLSEKDKKLEEKNQIIFALQNRVGELESKLKNMVALPLYQEEKKELILEQENLKVEKKILEQELKKERIKNIAIIGIVVVLVIVMLFLFGK